MKTNDDRPRVTIGGIIRHKYGTGFKITFSSVDLARKYKDMFTWMLKYDKFIVRVERGYYDKKEWVK